MAFIPNTDRDRKEMLAAVGAGSIEELLEPIPESLRLKGALALPDPLSECEAARAMGAYASASRGAGSLVSFLGAGACDHYVPAVVSHVTGRSEFYTAYTPYQAEVSQGTLQTIFEYQTLICRLTGMDVSNASVYDGGSALAEASLMAFAARKHRGRIVCSAGVHPHHRRLLKTYHAGIGTEIVEVPLSNGVTDPDALRSALETETAAVLLQSPNFLGGLEDVGAVVEAAHEEDALGVVSVNPISLGILKPPGEYGADIVVGEGQPLGNGLSFGGPYFGFFAAKKAYVRRLPGRLVGLTVDRDGRRGFVLTLQTREQHIRREKATSNICTNQALNALAASVYLSWLGEGGLQEVAALCARKAHYANDAIVALDGFEPLSNAPFFHEFAVRTPVPAGEIVESLARDGFLAGLDLGSIDGIDEEGLLIAVTEKRTRAEIDRFVDLLGNFSGGKG